MGPSSQGGESFFCSDALPCMRRCSWWVQVVRGRIVLFFCPDALPCVRRCSCWVPAVRGGIVLFFRPDALPCVRRCSWWVPAISGANCFFFGGNSLRLPWIQLSAYQRTVLFRWKSFLDHIDHTAPRAPGRWTTATPRKGTTRREDATVEARAERSTRVHWFSCGVRLPSPQNNRGCG